MNKIFCTTVALAAMAQPAFAQDVESVSGPYVGVQIAAARVLDTHTDSQGWYYAVSDFGMEQNGTIGGVHAGYDLGKGALVLGVLAEVNFGTLDTYAEATPEFIAYEIGSRSTMLGSARAKLGIHSGRLTAFANGGVAFSNAKHRYLEIDGSADYFGGNGSRTGWVAGIGFDYSLTKHSSIGLTASRYQFGRSEHLLLDSAGIPNDCSWSATATPDNLCHFTMRDKFDTVAISYSFRF